MRPALHGLGLAALISISAVSGTAAGERYGYDGYPGGYGFAGEAIGGSYVGAPLTRFPRPSELVPPAWSYGTYGIPTVTGIRQAPTAPPTLTVINGYEPAARHRGPRVAADAIDGRWPGEAEVGRTGQRGVRVISATVPRR